MKLTSILIEADDGTTYSLPLSEWTTENGVHGFGARGYFGPSKRYSANVKLTDRATITAQMKADRLMAQAEAILAQAKAANGGVHVEA